MRILDKHRIKLWNIAFVVLATTTVTRAAIKDQWKSRSIYQIVTDRFARSDNSTSSPCDPAQGQYCGGTFTGIIDKLDYIQDLGFSAIWISPITYPILNVTQDLAAYHGYWQQDLYSVNPSFGTPRHLKALSNAIHSRGMYLMVDVVVNNMAWPGRPNAVDYSTFRPFNSEVYYHPYRPLSADPYNETCVEECWIGDSAVSLPDLRTEDGQVSSMLYTWVEELVSNYSIDGLRLDSIFNVNREFWSGFEDAADVFCLGEGNTDSEMSMCSLQRNIDGLLNYPLYHRLTETFRGTNASTDNLIKELNAIRSDCKDIFALGTFTENQDVPRFASYTNDPSLTHNIITYNILGDGIPIIYYGEEQNLRGSSNPLNREALWYTSYKTNTSLPSLVRSLNHLRSHAIGDTSTSSSGNPYLTYTTQLIHNTTHTLALRKGPTGNQVVTVLSNLGSHPHKHSPEITVVLKAKDTGFHAKENVTEISSCQIYVTDKSGNLHMRLEDGGPRVFYPSNSLNGSKICGH